MSTPTETTLPDITTARTIAGGGVPNHVYAGAARTNGRRYVWGAGNPTVRPTGPDRVSCRAINVAAVNLGSLQLWVAIPVVRPGELRMPRGVASLNPQLRSGSLRTRSGNLDPSSIKATYSDATTATFRQAMALVEAAAKPRGEALAFACTSVRRSLRRPGERSRKLTAPSELRLQKVFHSAFDARFRLVDEVCDLG